MKNRYGLLAAALILTVAPSVILSVDRREADTDIANPNLAATASPHLAESKQVGPKPAQIVTSAAKPMTGEQINWQVISSGGGHTTSTNYSVDATVGQTAVGEVSSTSYKINQGFWQTFGPPACCHGTTGNVDGSRDGVVDISDVFAMVDYLSSSIPLSNCAAANDVNKDGTIDISDLFALIDYLTGAAPLPACP